MSFLTELEKKFPQAVESLCTARAGNRLTHSFLLVSESEKVRREFAVVLAQIAGCPSPEPSGRPDVTCSVCRAHLLSGCVHRSKVPSAVPLCAVWEAFPAVQARSGTLPCPEPLSFRSSPPGC